MNNRDRITKYTQIENEMVFNIQHFGIHRDNDKQNPEEAHMYLREFYNTIMDIVDPHTAFAIRESRCPKKLKF